MKIFNLALIALGAAFLAVISQISIPLGPVPITLQTLAVGLIAVVNRLRESVLSVLLYWLLGLIGLPVFHGGMSGIAVFTGPTGGFLVGFLLIALILSPARRLAWLFAVVAFLSSLIFGTIWLKFALDTSWLKAVSSGFAPFFIEEIVKALIAVVIGTAVMRQLRNTNKYFA